MSLTLISRLILLTALLLLLMAGLFPSPLTIGMTALSFSVLILFQAYAILKDDAPQSPHEQSGYPGYRYK